MSVNGTEDITHHAAAAVEETNAGNVSTTSHPSNASNAGNVGNAADTAHHDSVHEGRRVYIGNLAYLTTKEQLKEFFQGYEVEDTSIPTNPRTGRAVGYAFVDLKTKDDAERAMADLSGKEILERKVSVQLARKPAIYNKENEAPTPGRGRRRPFHPRYRGGNRRGRGGYRYHRSRPQKEQQQAVEGETAGPTNVPGQAPPLTEVQNENRATEETKPATEKKPRYNDRPRPRRKRGPPEDGVPSKTKVMVANLPYELTEEQLKDLFKDFEPEFAKIALRPIPLYMIRKLKARGEPRKGRGFGFVTLANEEMQQKAVAEMNGTIVQGREIAVKVAIDNPKLEEEAAAKAAEKEKAAEEAQATTNGVKPEEDAVAAEA